ncbi:acyl-CoA dehydrogenase family protein [Pseudanabaenaceae cyanobacterium LEGE 13415]|nr:acyl-CoA dehydrogenase family protein [Pseudanabaenaceae cyanobacterium LEGE 13415]
MLKSTIPAPSRPKPSIQEVLSQARRISEFAAHNASKVDHAGAFPIEEFKQIAAAGLLLAPLDRAVGGLGLGIDASTTYELLTILKLIGRGNLAVGRIYEGHVNALQLIQTFGTAEQIEQYAEDVRDRQKIFGVWNAEDVDRLHIIPLENGNYRLEGCKTFASGSGYVDRPFVNGTLPDGRWQMCIVPMDEVATIADPAWWQPSGMRATASYKVDFSGVELPKTALIGQPDDYYRQPWLTAGVVRFAAVQLGGAEALFDEARRFLHSLERTKDPYQEERFGKMAIALETGNLWLKGAADLIMNYAPKFAGSPNETRSEATQLIAYTNMVRTAIEQICLDVMQLVQRSVGTRGLLPPLEIDRINRDLTLYLRQPAFDAAIANIGQYALSHSESVDQLWQIQ